MPMQRETPAEIIRAWNTVVKAWREIESGYTTLNDFLNDWTRPIRAATTEEYHSFRVLDRAHLKYPYRVAAGE